MDLPEPYYQTEDCSQTIYCGDNREILPLIDPILINLVIIDPPYLITRGGSGLKGDFQYLQKIRNAELDMGIDFSWLNEFSNWFCFCSRRQLIDAISMAQIANWMLLVWYKTNPVPLINNTYLPDCEYIVHKYSVGRLFGGFQDKSRLFVSSIGGKSKFDHPTIKPLALIEKLLILGSQSEEIILDPCLGSGTTLVACQRLKRKGIGIEIREEYCEIAKKRLMERTLRK